MRCVRPGRGGDSSSGNVMKWEKSCDIDNEGQRPMRVCVIWHVDKKALVLAQENERLPGASGYEELEEKVLIRVAMN